MRPPVCEICDAEVDPATGLVTFRPDAESIEWRRRADTDGIVGHPPDTGWFCVEHVAAARTAAATLPYREGLRRIVERVQPPELDGVEPGDVDPGSGRVAQDDRFGQRWIAWDVPGIDSGTLVIALRDGLDGLCRAAGVSVPVDVASATERTWHPMDRTLPPNCPFADTHTTRYVGDDATVVIVHELAHWNEHDVSNTGVRLSITSGQPDPRDLVSISASSATGGGRELQELWLFLPATPVVVRAVDDLVRALA